MRKLASLFIPVLLAAFASQGSAQEQGKSTDTPKATTTHDSKPETVNAVVPLKVTVVFSEYDGEKKLSSLPYTLFLKASEEHRDFFGKVRMGVRVPIWVGGKDSAIQYQDVGSNIDCTAHPIEENRFLLDLGLERSSIYSTKEDRSGQSSEEQPHQPLLRTFRGNLAVMLRDGQATQAMVATDPLNGHIVKVDVTLNVVK
jgi:hypothetical protein